jgi:hypothetical protein
LTPPCSRDSTSATGPGRAAHHRQRPPDLRRPRRRHAGSRRDDRAERPRRSDRPSVPKPERHRGNRERSTLIVNHTALGALFTVDPATGASAPIAVDGLLPLTLDGLLLAGRDLWAVENFANTLVRVTLSPDLSSGTITAEITSPLFRVPTTVAKHGNRLALVNGRFDLGLPPPFGPGAPAGTDFDVVLVRAS